MIKTAHDEPREVAKKALSKIQGVNVRAVPCMGGADAQQDTLTGDDQWTHVKVQIIEFTALEMHPSPTSGKPLETPIKISNPGSSILNGSIKLDGTSTENQVEAANRMGARIAQVFFEKGVTSFPVEAILSGTYKSPQDGEERLMEAKFTIKDPSAKASCCVIA